MTLHDLLAKLDHVKPRGSRWVARCPAHADKTPSLSISEGERGLLVKCWAGCTIEEICAALGLRVTDLFFDAGLPRSQRPAPRPPKVDRVALAFRFDLAALDRHLRAERTFEAARDIDVSALTDEELHHALGHIAQASADIERAELFEYIADTLRVRDFTERTTRERETRVA